MYSSIFSIKKGFLYGFKCDGKWGSCIVHVSISFVLCLMKKPYFCLYYVCVSWITFVEDDPSSSLCWPAIIYSCIRCQLLPILITPTVRVLITRYISAHYRHLEVFLWKFKVTPRNSLCSNSNASWSETGIDSTLLLSHIGHFSGAL